MAEGGVNDQTGNRLINLMDSTEYPLRLVNGERVFGPNPHYSNIVPPTGSEVFVGQIPRNIYEDSLVPIFSTAGTIYELRCPIDVNGFNRGSALVTYLDVLSADRAVKLLNNYEIRPRHYIGITKFIDNCRLFVGGIPRELTRADLYTEFMKHTDSIKDVIVCTEPGDRKKNRGFAFIDYESHRAAAIAKSNLVPALINRWKLRIKVYWANPEPVSDPLVMQRVTVLYACNLPSGLNKAELMSLFSLSGQLRIVKVKKIDDFAFVHFETKVEAQLALTKVNGITINGYVIEVTWAKSQKYPVPEHSHCNMEGYKSSPQHLPNFQSDDLHLPSSCSASAVSSNFDNPVLLSDSSGASTSKFQKEKCSKLIVPGKKILESQSIVTEASSTPDEGQNKTSYSMLAKLGLINVDDGKPNSTLDVFSSGIHDNLVSDLSSLTLNDIDKGKGDCGLFHSSSDDIFRPYDGPSSQLSAMSKTTVAVRNISARTAQHSKWRTDLNEGPCMNIAASLFGKDSFDPSCLLRDLFNQQGSDKHDF